MNERPHMGPANPSCPVDLPVDLNERERRLLLDRCLTERDLAFMGPRQRALVMAVIAAPDRMHTRA